MLKRNKIASALIVVSSAVMLGGCGSAPVTGIVERIGVQHATIGSDERFLKLKGIDEVYACVVDYVHECATVEVGDKITLTVNVMDNKVASLHMD